MWRVDFKYNEELVRVLHVRQRVQLGVSQVSSESLPLATTCMTPVTIR